MSKKDELWIQATQNVATAVFNLQMAEFRRLNEELNEDQPVDLTLGGVAHRFVETFAMQNRTSGAGGTWVFNGYRYDVIKIIQAVRGKYNLGLKESKEFVERVLAAI